MNRLLIRTFAVAVLQTLTWAGDVFTVSASGPADFSNPQAAVQAASDGDVVLIEPGNYNPLGIVIVDKALDLIVTAPGVVLGPSVRIVGLAAGQTVSLVGWTAMGFSKFTVVDCDGHVRFERCNRALAFDYARLEIHDSNDVSIVDSYFVGEVGDFGGCNTNGCPGGPGLEVRDSTVTAYRCTFEGGTGGDGYWQVLGDEAGGGDGGPGALLVNANMTQYQCIFLGGQGGVPDLFGSGGYGNRGIPIDGFPPTDGSGPVNQLLGPDTVTEGEVYTLRVEAPPGHGAVLLVSTASQYRDLGPFVGQLLVASPFAFVPLGTIPASGLLTAPFTAPQLGAGDLGRAQRMQTMLVGPGYRYLGNPKMLVVLDDSL